MSRVPASALLLACLTACHTLSSPTNNDGADKGNPQNSTPSTPTLTLTTDSGAIAVGSGAPIHVYYDQSPLTSTTAITVISSDPTKVGCCAYGVSVGSATLTYSYNGLHASIDIAVHPNSAGAWARLTAELAPSTGGPLWMPDSVQVPVQGPAGVVVEFSVSQQGLHNAVFDAVPGAPSDIATATVPFSAPVARTFTTPGTFPFHCAVHGEQGVVVVTP